MKKILDVEYANGLGLDIYLPENDNFKCVVYFHGGGINSGDKRDYNYPFIAEQFNNAGIAFVSCNYNLYPNTKFPQYLQECALAVKYVFDHINEFGKCEGIYVSGQSAGAWLSMMLNVNSKYLEEVGLKTEQIKGWIIDSAQMTSHFNIITYEDGLDGLAQRIDEKAPLYFINPDYRSNPLLILYYEHDMPNRPEQNKLFYSVVKNYDAAYKTGIDIEIKELVGGHCHGSCEKNADGTYDYSNAAIEWLARH